MNFTDRLDKYSIKYSENVNTASLSTIKAGGNAKIVLYPDNSDNLILSIKLCLEFNEKYKIIGGCSNTFFSDEGYDGVIISTKFNSNLKIHNTYITADAGVTVSKLIKHGCDNDFEIASELYGIPGTLGGAIRNNAGAYGKEISDVFLYGIFLDVENLRTVKLSAADLKFSYRTSILQNNSFVFLSGNFRTERKSKSEVNEAMRFSIEKRRAQQPNLPSLGSFFKRIGNTYPSKLIDDAGLKGLCVGDASVSDKHAGFIVNKGVATSKDINLLAEKIENIIFEKYNIHIQREAEYVI